MVDQKLNYLSAVELAGMIRDRRVSPLEVVESCLARIDEVNPTLNCFCFVYHEEAREMAAKAEQAVIQGKSLGPLHGVPVAIKDLTPTKGRRTTMGSYAYEHWIPDTDAIVVENLLGAGAILVGKTTTPEFAYSSLTDSPLWGITRNPWNIAHTPGGSSGGSAAAVASRCVPIAEGSDAGGSVRIPASHCGIVGLKPSFGRVPFEFLPSQFDWMFCHGPLSRTVSDAALFLDVCQGPDERDIQTLMPALAIEVPVPSRANGLRLALSKDLGCYHVDKDVEKNLRRCANNLQDAGFEIEEVDIGWTAEFPDKWWAYWDVFVATHYGHLLDRYREWMHPTVVAAIENGLAMSAVDVKKTECVFTEAWKMLSPILGRCDALICPTESIPAPPVDYDELGSISLDSQGKLVSMDMTMQLNALKFPAISVPSGFSERGLPTGMQIVGRRGDDLTVLRIAAVLERLCPWVETKPGL
jgi:Asp-tRNA(Asn)/Glu-tRNA(Gln) amidotransferase A subunit family amidase